MKNIFHTSNFLFILFYLNVSTTFAQPDTQLSNSELLTQLAGDRGAGLSGVLNQLFYAGLIIAVVLAIFMIIRGGLEYMTIDIASTKEAAKNRIKAAIGGLILCFSTILILNTINPGLTSLELRFPQLRNLEVVEFEGQKLEIVQRNTDGTAIAQGSHGQTYNVGADGTITPITTSPGVPDGRTEAELRAYFAGQGIDINKAACIGANTSCTNLQGLGESAILGVVALKNASGANITITGGTEPGHKTHGVGRSIVDLRKDSVLDAYIINNQTSKRVGTYTTYTLPGGATYMDEGDHWHVVY